MGTDIFGFVEVRDAAGWRGVLDVSTVLVRDYDLFGCLFGVRNMAGFAPLFADRGWPQGVGLEVRRKRDEEFAEHPTWVTLEELDGIHRGALAPNRDKRLSRYDVDDDGELTLVSKAAFDSEAETDGAYEALRAEPG